MFLKLCLCTVLLILPLLGLAITPRQQTREQTQPPDLPPDYQQVIPRGRIIAINNPVYLPASKARIRDDAWVLGVVIDGQARAHNLTDCLPDHRPGRPPREADWRRESAVCFIPRAEATNFNVSAGSAASARIADAGVASDLGGCNLYPEKVY
jgi:hypothetical protein